MDITKLKLIGCGTRSRVYELDENWVVKEMLDDIDGFWCVVSLPEHIRKRFNMPYIDLKRSNIEEGIIVIEKLVRINYIEFLGTDKIHLKLNNLYFNWKEKVDIDQYLDSDHPLYEITKQAYRAYRFCNRIGYHLTLDLNPTNIMQRKDGGYVLSDPFGALDI